MQPGAAGYELPQFGKSLSKVTRKRESVFDSENNDKACGGSAGCECADGGGDCRPDPNSQGPGSALASQAHAAIWTTVRNEHQDPATFASPQIVSVESSGSPPTVPNQHAILGGGTFQNENWRGAWGLAHMADPTVVYIDDPAGGCVWWPPPETLAAGVSPTCRDAGCAFGSFFRYKCHAELEIFFEYKLEKLPPWFFGPPKSLGIDRIWSLVECFCAPKAYSPDGNDQLPTHKPPPSPWEKERAERELLLHWYRYGVPPYGWTQPCLRKLWDDRLRRGLWVPPTLPPARLPGHRIPGRCPRVPTGR